VEEYGLDALVASAEMVVAGLGPLVAGLAGLVVDAGRAETLDAMELVAAGPRGRGLLCGVVQHALDAQAAAEVRLAQVTGADGVARTRAEPGHARRLVTTVGPVRVARIAYRSGIKGIRSLFPRDAVLNLPPDGYSWQLQRLAEMCCRAGSYAQAHELVLAAAGVSIGKRQLEQITARAAADAERFCQDPGRPASQAAAGQDEAAAGQDQEDLPGQAAPAGQGGQDLPPLAISADGKGVPMLPAARRRRTKAPAQRVKTFQNRRGTGEKGHKRMAQTGCVFDVAVPGSPDGPARTPEQIMAPGGGTKDAPRAVNRWYACDITAGRDVTTGKIFDEACRRDPGCARDWIALADGDNHQIHLIEAEAAERGITGITILIDYIHVLEYLWKTAWCFHAPRDPAMEDWVIAQGLDILHGNAAAVIARIQALAAASPPRPGSEHDKNIRTTLHYLDAKQPYLDYPRALASGWPIATGVIEGACRHLVADRMGITGARWSLDGAQAMLWLRAIHASGDTDTYWHYHITREHQRNHLSRYQDGLDLAA
jgi:hypothetical protein